jgi:hypothetical protein
MPVSQLSPSEENGQLMVLCPKNMDWPDPGDDPFPGDDREESFFEQEYKTVTQTDESLSMSCMNHGSMAIEDNHSLQTTLAC